MLDKFLELSDAQGSLTDTSAASESYVDTLAAGNAIAPGARIRIAVQTAFVAASDAPTLAISLQSDSASDFGTVTTHITTSAALAAALTAGTVLLDIQLPVGIGRYIRAYYTIGGTGAFSAGNLDAHIVLDTARTVDKSL